jgi:hypothetical protein
MIVSEEMSIRAKESVVRYPGPILARVSRLWAARHVMKYSQHEVYHDLFEIYNSDVVRTGQCVLSLQLETYRSN